MLDKLLEEGTLRIRSEIFDGNSHAYVFDRRHAVWHFFPPVRRFFLHECWYATAAITAHKGLLAYTHSARNSIARSRIPLSGTLNLRCLRQYLARPPFYGEGDRDVIRNESQACSLAACSFRQHFVFCRHLEYAGERTLNRAIARHQFACYD